jgi:protein gp37
MNKTKIDWADYTWNPVVGCKHGCSYCYAKRLNDRFNYIPDWTKPTFYPERLGEPYKIKKPSKIFVGSMCDLFGSWIKDSWIEKILEVVEENPRHQFMFLTKNSYGYDEFSRNHCYYYYFPKNAWLGVTVTGLEKDAQEKIDELRVLPYGGYKTYTFVSFEPLLSDVSQLDISGIDLIIVGAMTGVGAIKPKKEWIKGIKHKNIFYKSNIKEIK